MNAEIKKENGKKKIIEKKIQIERWKPKNKKITIDNYRTIYDKTMGRKKNTEKFK